MDGAIHVAAGPWLLEECIDLKGCETGSTKITRGTLINHSAETFRPQFIHPLVSYFYSGYNLPARHVLHTVGPTEENDEQLIGCYHSCLELVAEHGLRTVAFCGISTGIFGFPLYRASRLALETIRKWLEYQDNYKKVRFFLQMTYLKLYLGFVFIFCRLK